MFVNANVDIIDSMIVRFLSVFLELAGIYKEIIEPESINQKNLFDDLKIRIDCSLLSIFIFFLECCALALYRIS